MEPPKFGGRTPGRSAKVAHQRPDDLEQEQVEQGKEQQSDHPQSDKEAIHQWAPGPSMVSTASTTSSVSPSSILSPTPSTTSSMVVPLTREPFVLWRSV